MRKNDFSTYTLLITYFLATVGVLATVLVESIELPFIFIMSGAAILTLVLNIKGKEILNSAIWNLLAISVLAVFIIRYVFVSESVIATLSMFLTVLLVLKLFDLKRNRDYFQVYVIVFFQVLAAAASTASPLFFLVLFLFIIGGIWAMIIFNIKRDFLRDAPDYAGMNVLPPDESVFGIKFFLSIVVISAFSMLMASVLFFILPRMGAGFFERKTADEIKVTGFSSSVDLDTLGPIKKDSTVVMRVELDRVPGKLVYFRGNSLDRYDGKIWSKTIRGEKILKRDARGSFAVGKAAKGPDLLEQNILLEPLDTDVLFAASRAISIEGYFPNVWIDGSGSIRLPSPPYSRIEYRAVSDLSEEGSGSDKVRPEYSDSSYIEKDPLGPRIIALAAEITKEEKTDAGKARAIEKYLKTHYTYTLDPVRSYRGSALDDFLFYSRQGFCEHYATAMVILLRSSGVPARIVTGFLQGEWNGIGNYFIVRQEDAHSWVEAYIDGSGWVTFDPTPSAGLVPYSRPSRIALYLDLLRWRWNRYIIHFSLADQKKAAAAVRKRTSGLLSSIHWSFKRPRLKANDAAVIAMTAALAVLVLYLLARKYAISAKNRKTPGFYLEMENVLRKKGFLRLPNETPMEFALRIDLDEAKEITEAFHLVRYGGGALSKDGELKIKSALARLGAKKART